MLNLKRLWDFVKIHKLWFVAALVPIAFVSGYYATPTKIHTEYVDRVKVEEKIVKQVEVQVQEKIKVVERQGEERVKIVFREVKPDGTKTERIEERERKDVERSQEFEKTLTTRENEIKELRAERETLFKKIQERKDPRIMLGLSVGYDANPTWLRIPTAPNLALGVDVKARIVGPVWLGVSAYQTGLVAGTVSVAF